MTDRDDFLAWVKTTLYEAELALHNGDAAPRRALWSRNEPVSVLGAWRNAHGQDELDELFTVLGRSFSDCTSYAFEFQAYDVVGDMAYTAGLEHTSASVDGQPRSYTLAGHPGVSPRGRRVEGGPSAWRHRDRVTVPDNGRLEPSGGRRKGAFCEDEDFADHVGVLLVARHEADHRAPRGIFDDLCEAFSHDVLEGHPLADHVVAVAAVAERLLDPGEAAAQQADDQIAIDVGLGLVGRARRTP